VETGSSITWKYPSVVLAGEGSVGEFYSVALTNNCQQVGLTGWLRAAGLRCPCGLCRLGRCSLIPCAVQPLVDVRPS